MKYSNIEKLAAMINKEIEGSEYNLEEMTKLLDYYFEFGLTNDCVTLSEKANISIDKMIDLITLFAPACK